MTIGEAVELVLQAGTMGQGGEIFILNMGDPVRIVDMAEQMIRLSGREPYTEIPIVFTGLRQGEKLFEEILSYEEGLSATHHSQIFVAKQNGLCLEAFFADLAELERLTFPDNVDFRILGNGVLAIPVVGHKEEPTADPVLGINVDQILEVLRRLVPEFKNSRFLDEENEIHTITGDDGIS